MGKTMTTTSTLRSLTPWFSLVGIILLKSTTNTISNFPAYSAELVQLLSISSVQLNGLIVAAELGNLFDCVCTVAEKHLPLWGMLTIGMTLGSVAYVVQFLFLVDKITYLSYWHLVLLHVLAGNSTCWFNSVCSHVAKTNFPVDYQIVIALTSAYSGLSGKFYTLLVEAVHGPGARNASTCLLLNCIVPVGVGFVFLLIVRDPPERPIKSVENGIFSFILTVAAITGGYAVIDSVAPAVRGVSPILKGVILLTLIIFPVVVPIRMFLEGFKHEKCNRNAIFQLFGGNHGDKGNGNMPCGETVTNIETEEMSTVENEVKQGSDEMDEEKGDLWKEEEVHDNELGVKEQILSVDFWLYFMVNACGPTLVMSYFNNLGRISKSRSEATAPFLLAVSSSFGFFARLFTVLLDWFPRGRNIVTRPAAMAVLTVPMTASFFLLLNVGNQYMYTSTAILGVCSGIIATITGMVTEDLFGSKNSAISHPILFANIPIGVLLYGSMAALNADSEGNGAQCIGLKCFHTTFIIWGSICSMGIVFSFILYLRTRKNYLKSRGGSRYLGA